MRYFNKRSGEGGINAIVLMVCVSAVALIIGFTLMGSMEKASDPITTGTTMSTSQTTMLTYFGSSSEMLAFGLFVMALMMIVSVMIAYLGRGEQ